MGVGAGDGLGRHLMGHKTLDDAARHMASAYKGDLGGVHGDFAIDHATIVLTESHDLYGFL